MPPPPAAFLVLIDALVLIQGLIVTRLLGPDAIGLYGVVSTTVISLIALKRVGIDEAFVQQESPTRSGSSSTRSRSSWGSRWRWRS